jgi:hypothetical protein
MTRPANDWPRSASVKVSEIVTRSGNGFSSAAIEREFHVQFLNDRRTDGGGNRGADPRRRATEGPPLRIMHPGGSGQGARPRFITGPYESRALLASQRAVCRSPDRHARYRPGRRPSSSPGGAGWLSTSSSAAPAGARGPVESWQRSGVCGLHRCRGHARPPDLRWFGGGRCPPPSTAATRRAMGTVPRERWRGDATDLPAADAQERWARAAWCQRFREMIQSIEFGRHRLAPGAKGGILTPGACGAAGCPRRRPTP